MAFDEGLAHRIREALGDLPGLDEKKMFGGIGFMVNGNMACGVHKDDLIVRVGPEGNDEAISSPYARPFDLTGKPMSGWVYVDPAGVVSDEQLCSWVQLGVDFARTLPAK